MRLSKWGEIDMLKNRYDVIIAGGGPAGITAAIASARNGAKTLLIERYGFLGGMATNALVGPIQTFHATPTIQVVHGIAEEIIQRLKVIRGTPGHVRDMIGFVPTITPVDVEKLKYVYQELLLESRVDLLLHTTVVGVKKEDSLLKAIQVQNKSGIFHIYGSIFIDCTGDGDVLTLSELPYEKGRKTDGLAQPMSMMFRVGGVDFQKVRNYIEKHPEEFVLAPDWKSMSYVAVSGFFRLVEEAKKNGDLTIERDRVLFFQLPTNNEVTVNMTRVIRYDATDGEALSHAEIIGRRQVMEVMNFLNDYIPGFENAFLINCGTQIGVRESRRLVGNYVLTGEDVVNGRTFSDVIALGSYPIDIHAPDGKELHVIKMPPGTIYHIPYRSLTNPMISNLLVAGRCLSATHEALASARVTPTAMFIGQAAGTAAALANKLNCLPNEIDVKKVQQLLREQGCYLSKEEIPETNNYIH